MKYQTLFVLAVLVTASLLPRPTSALTMNQFTQICESNSGDCSEHPVLQAYVGGALDLVAMLDEETDYLSQVYCTSTKVLFNVPKIIRYMTKHKRQYADKNAMLLVIRYLEEYGEC